MPGGSEVVDADKEDFNDGGRRRQANRDKRLARAKRLRADREELDRLRKKPWSSGVDAKQQDQKGKGKGKTKDQAGTPLCFSLFSFASGTGLAEHLNREQPANRRLRGHISANSASLRDTGTRIAQSRLDGLLERLNLFTVSRKIAWGKRGQSMVFNCRDRSL
jgi:hypothetical protein